jgi:hypothetical protein
MTSSSSGGEPRRYSVVVTETRQQVVTVTDGDLAVTAGLMSSMSDGQQVAPAGRGEQVRITAVDMASAPDGMFTDPGAVGPARVTGHAARIVATHYGSSAPST